MTERFDAQMARNEWLKSPTVQYEFDGDFEAYAAYLQARQNGLIRYASKHKEA